LQALWFCLQVITRLATELPISALELNTLGDVFFAFCVFVLWWNKPLDVYEPFTIPLGNDPSVRSLCAALYLRSSIGFLHRSGGGREYVLEFTNLDLDGSIQGSLSDQGGSSRAVIPEAPEQRGSRFPLRIGEETNGLRVRYVVLTQHYFGCFVRLCTHESQ